MGMMKTNVLGNSSRTYQMPWRRCMSFIDNIQTIPSLFLVRFVARKGSDVTDVNIRHHLPIDGIHP
jgi:hypothetical protein